MERFHSEVVILSQLLNDQVLNHEDLILYIKSTLCKMPMYKNLLDNDIDRIAFEYEKIHGAKTFDSSVTIKNKEANDEWFYLKQKKMSNNDHAFENRYKEYLSIFKKLDNNAISHICKDAEKILSFCSDPDSNEKKRGLVMGDVQSGKTANYIALANIAIDYGYKIILVLAGMTDSLRIQTQERIDEGIIGAISSSIGEQSIKYIGVGTIGLSNAHYAIPLTNDLNDFKSISTTSNDFNKPLILVVKKNKTVLTAVKKWLKPGSNKITSRNILIIDDECDNASVNTKSDEDPTTINRLIRNIYNNFNCATYVGYTATPFANIFINPEKKLGDDDLFPSDFIHRLHASNFSYFGANRIFENRVKLDDEGKATSSSIVNRHIRIISEDEENFLATKHKKDDSFLQLPVSLKEAICNFLICNCIRTLRGDPNQHRTMMINISRFNSMQEQIRYLVQDYIDKLHALIGQFDKKPLEKFLKQEELKRIYQVFENDKFFNDSYDDLPALNTQYSFEKIKDGLFDEISKFMVTIVNNKYKGDQRFNYQKYKETGARVIAIGGFVLSRGLTLEGLMTSYYNRNSTAYDTLLQMCRWFGYRPNYEDLCSIYMTEINYDCFCAVLDSIQNLDEQLLTMESLGKTPEDFGLMIRESPDTLETNLLITARNKSKNSEEIIRQLNYSGVVVDTSKLFNNPKKNQKNLEWLKLLYNQLISNGYKLELLNNRHMFRDINKTFISNFIRNISIPIENKKFNQESIADFIDTTNNYPKWDIVFATGNNDENKFKLGLNEDLSISPIIRTFEIQNEDEKIIRISKNNNRIVEPGIFNSGLSLEQIEEIKKKCQEKFNQGQRNSKDPVAQDWLDVEERNPLLVILPTKLKPDNDTSKKLLNPYFKENLILGFGLGFAGRKGRVMMKFKINKVKLDEYRKHLVEEEDEVDD